MSREARRRRGKRILRNRTLNNHPAMLLKTVRILLAVGLASLGMSAPQECFAQKGKAKRLIDQEFRSGNLSARERNQLKREVDRAKPREVREAVEAYEEGGYRPHVHRPQQSRPQQTYMRPQSNYPTQPSVAAPAPAPAPPANAAPPKEIAAPKNDLLSVPPPASSARLRKLQIKIEEYIDDTLQAISRDFQQGERDRAWHEDLIQRLNGEGANPLYVDQLARLLAARTLDLDNIDELFRELRMSDESVARIRGQLQLSVNLQQLKRMLEDGEDSTRITRVLRDMQRKSTAMQTAKKGRQAIALRNLRQALDSLSEASLLRDILTDRAADGAGDAWPSGEVTIVYDPDCPRGEAWLLAEDAVLASPPEGEEFSVTRGSMAAALGASVFASPAISEATSDARISGIRIANPTTVAFPFTLNGQQYKLAAGAAQDFPFPSAKIEFVNVAQRPARAYTLAAGRYRFTYSAGNGWDVGSHEYVVTIDNEKNSHAFRYLVDGKEVTLAAGQKQEHRSIQPIAVVFDQGDGGAPAKKTFAEDSQVVRVGVGEDGRRWDLFPDDASPTSELDE